LNSNDNPWFALNTTVDIAFFFDIIVNFRSAYYDKEFELIDDSRTLAK